MLLRLVRAPSRFFDTTPVGRILNRFTSDMNTVDGTLHSSARSALGGVMTFIASFLFIVYVIPQFAPFAVLIAWLYIRLSPPYVKTARDLRRLESVSISPAFSGFDELLRGITHVRAFGMEKRYQEAFYRKVDLFQGFDHVYVSASMIDIECPADTLPSGWWRVGCAGDTTVCLDIKLRSPIIDILLFKVWDPL
jgi:ABC-type multidrug transport system fused ATPase/permease subunit